MKLVVVTWRDAVRQDGERLVSEVAIEHAVVVRDIGFVLRDDDDEIVLGNGLSDPGGDTVRQYLVIPRAMVIDVHELKAVVKP